MQLTTSKIEAGRYRVLVNGRPTPLIIEKGEPPKYRQRQEWCIGLERPSGVQWLSTDQTSKQGALDTVACIARCVAYNAEVEAYNNKSMIACLSNRQ